MKDSILNTIVIAVAFASIVFAALDDKGSSASVAQQARQVPVLEKTVVAARRLPANDMLVASAAR